VLRRTVLAEGAALLLPAAFGRSARGEALQTLTPGVLRIGTYFVNPPFEFVTNGKKVGFEVDLMNEIAGRLKLRPEYIGTEWEAMLPQMRQSRFDCIVGGITLTPERSQILAWSNPYITTTLSLIVNTARMPQIRDLAGLKGATVGLQAATTDYDVAVKLRERGEIKDIKVYPFARIADAIADLKAGRITAVMKVNPVAAWLARRNPGLKIVAQVPDDPQPLGIGFSKDTPELVAAVNRQLAAMMQDGSYARLARKWDVS